VSTISKVELIKKTIETFKTNLQLGGFEVSQASMKSQSHAKMAKALEELADDTNLPVATVALVKEEATILENVVFAEAVTKKIYTLPARRFNTECLLLEPHKLLKQGTFQKLEEVAKSDFASSCRCILFGESTAAAFHILRCTESVLKSYYFHHRRQNRLPKPMWANMVDQLKVKTRNKPPAALLISLDLIRTAYRNPTQHPEALYEIDSAQDLFGVCIDVIGKMADEL
jgi:hypothetical protein